MNIQQVRQRTPHLALETFVLAVWCIMAIALTGGNEAYAQNTNATIRGQVLDPTGALVPNAQVVIVNQNTGVTVFSGKTDTAGAFVAPQVIPGNIPDHGNCSRPQAGYRR